MIAFRILLFCFNAVGWMGGVLPQVGDCFSCFAFLFYTTVLPLCFLHVSKICGSGKKKSKRDLIWAPNKVVYPLDHFHMTCLPARPRDWPTADRRPLKWGFALWSSSGFHLYLCGSSGARKEKLRPSRKRKGETISSLSLLGFADRFRLCHEFLRKSPLRKL